MFKIQIYNLKINDEYDALSLKYPTYKKEEYKKRRRESAGRMQL
jgi:hypothetical protein